MSESIVTEQWKPVVEYEGTFEVSNLGRVKSVVMPGRRRTERILVASRGRGGYLRCCLCMNCKSSTKDVHKLVASAFLGNALGRQVNHIDGDKNNNSVSNLEYVSSSQNIRHAYRTGLMRSIQGERHPKARLTTEDVIFIRGYEGAMPGKELSDKFGISQTAIGYIRSRRTWKHVT